MQSLRAAKQIIAICQTIYTTAYVMDATGAIYPASGNGPFFNCLEEALHSLTDHISTKHIRQLAAAIGQVGPDPSPPAHAGGPT